LKGLAMVHDTMSAKQRNALRVVRGLVALAFILFGMLKLIGVPMMVTVFDDVGFGQWFRYVTGLIEMGGAIMLLSGVKWKTNRRCFSSHCMTSGLNLR
jgi:uncharacterized membrane protein YphA (DoxX/SURF4 family)